MGVTAAGACIPEGRNPQACTPPLLPHPCPLAPIPWPCPLLFQEEVKAATQELERLVQEGVFARDDCGLLHGQMAPADKDAVLARFKAGQLKLLVRWAGSWRSGFATEGAHAEARVAGVRGAKSGGG